MIKNNDMENKNKVGTYDIPEEDLRMELATFADGSRINPRISLQLGKKYVVWRDNANPNFIDYPNKLIELYNNSSLHHSIIDMKAEQIAGGGLELVDTGDTKAVKTLEFLNKINKQNIDCNEINKRIALELTIFNGFSVQTIWKKDWSGIDSLVHMEFNKIRNQTPDSEGNQYGYFYAFDWSLYRPSRIQYIEKFNPDTANLRKSEYKAINDRIMKENQDVDVTALKSFVKSGSTQLFYYKQYQPQTFYYPIPDYVGVIPSIEIDILSDIYANSSLANGMDNGIVITLLGDSSDPESQKTARRILKSYAGARKAGKPVILFTEDFELAPKIDNIGNNNSLAAKYKTINDSTQQKILSGHRIPNSSMVGIATAGKLGNSQETQQAEEIFFQKYIRPRQEILESFWNKIMKVNGLASVRIKNTNVFNQAAIQTEKAGLDVDTTGDENNNQIIKE